MKKVLPFIIYFVVFMYMEILFKIIVFENAFNMSIINVLSYTLFISLFLYMISGLLSNKTNKIVMYFIVSLSSIWFIMQVVVFKIFKIFFSFNEASAAEQVVDFAGDIFVLILKNSPYIILFLIPLVVLILLNKKIIFAKLSKKHKNITLVCLVVSFCLYNSVLLINKNDIYSSYELYYNQEDTSLNMQKLGVLSTMHQNIIKIIFQYESEVILKEVTSEKEVIKEETIYDYNNLNIDFNNMLSDNNVINDLNNYFKNDKGTLKNEYTGLFKDKNLVFILAETFNEIAVNKIITPTLYNLVNEGFTFNNFYSPTIYSTIGGEYQLLTSLYPSSGFMENFKSYDNTYAYPLADTFKSAGYTTYAYHNNTYSFQSRHIYLSDMGFTNYKACKNGLELLIDCEWLQSDIEMISTTTSEYIKSDKFMTYYVTVSGHGDYYLEGDITKKYLDLIPEVYTEKTRSYLAAQVELDRALEVLISDLDKNNILEDTVIVLVGDHHPYYLTTEEINVASSYIKDGVVEIDHSNLIIWNSEMENVVIDKVGSQLDVLPTMYNLFDIPYDSRLFMGKDILSTEPGIAIFSDKSWVTDYGTYFALEDKFVAKDNTTINTDYVQNINNTVINKTNISKLILDNNYYNYIKYGG